MRNIIPGAILLVAYRAVTPTALSHIAISCGGTGFGYRWIGISYAVPKITRGLGVITLLSSDVSLDPALRALLESL